MYLKHFERTYFTVFRCVNLRIVAENFEKTYKLMVERTRHILQPWYKAILLDRLVTHLNRLSLFGTIFRETPCVQQRFGPSIGQIESINRIGFRTGRCLPVALQDQKPRPFFSARSTTDITLCDVSHVLRGIHYVRVHTVQGDSFDVIVIRCSSAIFFFYTEFEATQIAYKNDNDFGIQQTRFFGTSFVSFVSLKIFSMPFSNLQKKSYERFQTPLDVRY